MTTAPAGMDRHTHRVTFGILFTTHDSGHRHRVQAGASRTKVADGHDHRLPAAWLLGPKRARK